MDHRNGVEILKSSEFILKVCNKFCPISGTSEVETAKVLKRNVWSSNRLREEANDLNTKKLYRSQYLRCLNDREDEYLTRSLATVNSDGPTSEGARILIIK